MRFHDKGGCYRAGAISDDYIVASSKAGRGVKVQQETSVLISGGGIYRDSLAIVAISDSDRSIGDEHRASEGELHVNMAG